MQAPTASYVDYVIYKEADSTKKSNLPPDKKAQLMRQLRFEKTNNQFTSSVLPKTESQHMMRLCITDNVKDHMQMQREVNLGRMVWTRWRLQTSAVFDKEVSYGSRSPNPRPFFIYEPRGLTLQELLTLSKTNSVDINTARHITVGILHTVRVLHHFGYVHRCVDTTTFGLKKDFNGKILSDAVQCHSLWYARKYRNNKVRRRGPFIGSYLFSSLEAMSGIEQLPNDDMISAMYIFLCLCFGYLPWMKPKTTNGIWNKKSAFQSNPSWFPSRSNVSYNINGIAEAFEAISSYNSLLPNQKIYAKLTEILKKNC
ncbi:unnamed protein product [Bursaphelenchus okinawaensis]|uniref:Protein kinase domain-containing protein n=1 Tax=Bursaphelenchus okinawaensis TaxID=465554 RepID=A0A811LIC4_9BILA|nr:unnamed protein product [Bursaphelenchus okinawaensis]CAG9123173.1 unnamed protein product [Bursaphelenchus okinawaensis]